MQTIKICVSSMRSMAKQLECKLKKIIIALSVVVDINFCSMDLTWMGCVCMCLMSPELALIQRDFFFLLLTFCGRIDTNGKHYWNAGFQFFFLFIFSSSSKTIYVMKENIKLWQCILLSLWYIGTDIDALSIAYVSSLLSSSLSIK